MATNKTARAKRVQAKAATEKTRLEAMYTTEAMVITISEAKAAAEATAIPDSEEKATPEATAIPDSEEKATAEATAIHDSEEKATTEATAIPYSEAKAIAEVEAQAIAEASKPPLQLATTLPQLSNEERRRLLPTTLIFEQEQEDPPDVLVCSSKPRPQDSTQDVNIPSFETRFDETPDASVEETSTLAPATEESKVVPLDVNVEGPGTLVPTVGGAKARTFDARTTVSRSSDAKSLEARYIGGKRITQARHLGDNQDFQPPERGSRFFGLNLPLP